MSDNKKCPMCGKKIDEKFKPFCSKRCADLDLYKWLNGNYAIATDEFISNDNDLNEENQ
ncbi:MAG: DNA gyrase inhibitor YacG [Alphaproteobacteria bacterium ADurb.Bin438]|nr:MAG: DNA gyrase inhibitor YacG [Alphaproteobacteria bacterium ADurb.Bin438]